MLRPCALLSAAVLLACAAASADRTTTAARQAGAAHKSAVKRTATAGGVSITYDTSLAPEVRAGVSPASPLESPTDKPDWFWPERAVFDLSTAYPAPTPAAGRAEIYVCSVEDFKKAAAVSEELVRRVGLTVRDLRLLLRRRPAAPPGAIPTLPFPDAHNAFRARLKYLRFKNGSGVAYLTQSQQDEGLVNNEQLTYEFRGLTDDGRHYVYASLPAAAPSLPATRDAAGHDGYSLPRTFDGPGRAAKLRAYRNYAGRVKRRLERLPPDAFTPNLRLIDETLSSLEVNK